jgi:hypothetical protein
MPFPSTNWFRKLVEDALENTAAIDLNADTIKCALFTDAIGGTFNFDTNLSYGSAPWNANEVVGAGYTAGGAVLASPTVGISTGVVAFDAGDASWTTATITARGGLVYDDTLSAGNKYGIVAVNFGSDFSSTAGTFTVTWNAAGILTFS